MTGVRPDWIALDWGATQLRAYAMGADGPLAEAASDDGASSLARDAFEPALLRLIDGWLAPGMRTEIIACGMVGARQGWHEAPARTTPCTPIDPAALVVVPTIDPRLHLRLVPGLCQMAPADVMRGEETQIAGALAVMPDFDGVLCLPGTYSKWAHVSAGEVVSFQTCMTGELFTFLSQRSILRHCCQGKDIDEQSFISALDDAISRPEKISTRLFSLHAEALLAGLSPAAARARLSGLLIGIELAATKAYWLGQNVALICDEDLGDHYARALARQGVTVTRLPVAACAIAGLNRARARPSA